MTAGPARQRKRLTKGKIERGITAALFLLPSIAVFFIIKYIPLVQCVYYSFFKYSLPDPPGAWVGLKNYINTFTSDQFWQFMGNTAALFGYTMLFGFFTPLIQALLLNELRRGKGIYRYLYVLPAGVPTVAAVAVWRYIWNIDAGLANQVVGWLGISPQMWIASASQVKACLRFPLILGGGMGLLIYMVTINNVSWETHEAAIVDGATAWQRMWRITLPNIWYMVEIQFLLNLTTCLLAFDDVYMLTKGGPGTSSYTAVLGIYNKSFNEQNFGQGMAMSVVVFLITLLVTLGQLKLQRGQEAE